jgi:F420-dependent oxidoreductase-like protein
MKISMNVPHLVGPAETAAWAASMESAGVDVLWAGEAYGFDAVSMLGFLASRTSTVQLGSAILPVFSRSPALTAMTAAGLDFVSSGRFILGLGASGPQVVRSWYGVPYERPLERTRETIEVCRLVWARERLDYQGAIFQVPGASASGTVADRPLKFMDWPLRPDIPIYVAALGPKNVALTAELANGWLPIFFHPDKHDVWSDGLARGCAQRDPGMEPLEIVAGGSVCICDEAVAERIRDAERSHVALYVGGMGSVGHNFYNDLFVRYGYGDEARRIQELYLSGHKSEAEAVVPAEFLKSTLLIGNEGHVRDRIEAYKAAGVTCLNIEIPDAVDDPLALVEKLRSWLPA